VKRVTKKIKKEFIIEISQFLKKNPVASFREENNHIFSKQIKQIE